VRVEQGRPVGGALTVGGVPVVIAVAEAVLTVIVAVVANVLRGVDNDKSTCKMGQECDWLLKRPESNNPSAGVS